MATKILKRTKFTPLWESSAYVLALYVDDERFLYSEKGELVATGHDPGVISPYTMMHWVRQDGRCTFYKDVAEVKALYDKWVDSAEMGHPAEGLPVAAFKIFAPDRNGKRPCIRLAIEWMKVYMRQAETIVLCE